jgi:hypothetical protein
MTIRRITIALFSVFAPSLTFAQSSRGTITDSQNARVPGVEVTALHVANQLFSTVSSGEGSTRSRRFRSGATR